VQQIDALDPSPSLHFTIHDPNTTDREWIQLVNSGLAIHIARTSMPRSTPWANLEPSPYEDIALPVQIV